MKIGVFGGTFDPFHEADLAIVDKVIDDKIVDEVIILPTVVNYYRKEKKPWLDAEQKAGIILRYVTLSKNTDKIKLDLYEFDQLKGKTEEEQDKFISSRRYVNMLIDLQKRLGTDGNTYYTIIGGDSLQNFKSWASYDIILQLSKLIAVMRNDEVEFDSDIDFIPVRIDGYYATVSSSMIRSFYLDKRNSVNPYYDYWTSIPGRIKLIDDIHKAATEDQLLLHTPIFDVMSGVPVQEGFRPIRIKSVDWVSIIVEKEGKWLMEKQLRYGTMTEVEEMPTGMIEPGEQPLYAAVRELREETGYRVAAGYIDYIGKFASNPGCFTNYMHYFYVNLDKVPHHLGERELDEHEQITCEWKDKKEVIANFGKLGSDKTCPALMAAALWQLHACGLIA